MRSDVKEQASQGNAVMTDSVALRGVIGHDKLTPQCELGFLDNGFRCDLPATAYVEFHMVGHCRRFDCDTLGNACGFVCAGHRDALAYTAQCTAKEMQPTALSRRLLSRVARCPTCGRTVLSASDILQVVVSL
jgi:hypothetical protein